MNVMLVNFNSPYHVDIARKMLTEGSINVSTIVGDYPTEMYSDLIFSGIQKLDAHHFRMLSTMRRMVPQMEYVLSGSDIIKYRELEVLFLENSDRFSFIPISVRDRRELYYLLLSFFINHFLMNRYDCVLFRGVPHMGFDNVIYAIAKNLEIPIFMVEQTLIDGRSIIVEDYEKWYTIPEDFLSNTTTDEVIKEIDSQLLSNVMGDNRELKAIKREQYYTNQYYGVRLNAISRRWGKIGSVFVQSIKRIYSFLVKVESGKRLFSSCILNEYSSWIKYLRLVWIYNQKLKDLKKYYDRHAVIVNKKDNYIFFALHLQPEKNTAPLGGVFDDQLLAIEILSNSIPQGWSLYVKEHPVQFNTKRTNNHHYRSIEFYKRIVSMKNVKLVAMADSHEEIMLHARATSTVTGTTAWQGLLNGIPAIVFGNKWFTACSSVYRVQSVSDCKNAIEKIVHTKKEDVRKDLMIYLAYYQQFLIKAAYEARDLDLIDLPRETQIDNYIITLKQFIDSRRKNVIVNSLMTQSDFNTIGNISESAT